MNLNNGLAFFLVIFILQYISYTLIFETHILDTIVLWQILHTTLLVAV